MASMFSSTKPGETLASDVRSSSGSGRAATTVIARGVKVEGEFSSQGDVLIEGEVHGNLAATGLLTVGTEAKIIADIRSGDAVISGMVEGSVTVEKSLVLKSTAKIIGDLTAQSVTVEAGAAISGRMSVGAKAVSEVSAPFESPSTKGSKSQQARSNQG